MSIKTFLINRFKPSPSSPASSADKISASSFFDAGWYLERNPEVAASGLDPVTHYLDRGAAAGRNPGPAFDAAWYLQQNPDVVSAGLNPLLHYLEFGQKEARVIRPVPDDRLARLISASALFDSAWYADHYPDVANSGLDPVAHYLDRGAASGFNPGPDFDSNWYVSHNPDVADAGFNPLVHYLEFGAAENRAIKPADDPDSVHALIRNRFAGATPLPLIGIPPGPLRLNVVAENLDNSSLYENGGAPIILAALLAKRLGAEIRLISRNQPPSTETFSDALAGAAVTWEQDAEFLHLPPGGNRQLPLSSNDVFLTTSWQTTQSLSGLVTPDRIFYLVQNDERLFYPFGDDRLRCAQTLTDSAICRIVCGRQLFEHLNLPHAMWFEPAFPETVNCAQPLPGSRKQFLFYMNTDNPCNLIWQGLETIASHVESGLLNPNDWEFHLVGCSLKRVALPGKPLVHLHNNLRWPHYNALLRTMDMAFCRFDTPYTTYPQSHLAAMGIELLDAPEATNKFLHDWNAALDPVVDRIAALIRTEVR